VFGSGSFRTGERLIRHPNSGGCEPNVIGSGPNSGRLPEISGQFLVLAEPSMNIRNWCNQTVYHSISIGFAAVRTAAGRAS